MRTLEVGELDDRHLGVGSPKDRASGDLDCRGSGRCRRSDALLEPLDVSSESSEFGEEFLVLAE
jgi:hypothetical protein